MTCDRVMIAAPKSGSGKTMLTCGLLRCLQRREKNPVAFKSGPDYIDPMFHTKVLGVPSQNLDLFFSEEETVRMLFQKATVNAGIAVIEGAMGYFDGMRLDSTKASAYELSLVLQTPVIFVVDAKGMGYSVTALLKGLQKFRENAPVKGVILNRISPSLCERLKPVIEKETGLFVLGCMPNMPKNSFSSRHLGLLQPSECEELEEKINRIADALEETVEIEKILTLAKEGEADNAKEDFAGDGKIESKTENFKNAFLLNEANAVPFLANKKKQISIAVARDAAFSFYYEDNLNVLQEMGAKLLYFSPLRDKKIPDHACGLLLGGGYPELYLEELSKNTSMLQDIREANEKKMPILAECGGFLYLLSKVLDQKKEQSYPLVGLIQAEGFYTGKLTRFGYVSLEANEKGMQPKTGEEGAYFEAQKALHGMKGHEFHYYDTTDNGNDMLAIKPSSSATYPCMHVNDHLVCGFAHLYYRSRMEFVDWFLKKADAWKNNL